MSRNALHSRAPSHPSAGFDTTQSAHGADSLSQNLEVTSQVVPLKSRAPENPRILVVTDDDTLAKELDLVFRQAGLPAERTPNMAEGSEAARSGRFQVVVTAPQLKDGSWKGLARIAHSHRSGFAVIFVAETLDPRQRVQAIAEGALDVLDGSNELARVPEAARRALWIEYLTGAWPNLEIPTP
jgi:CheY-like chemotaxis protein